MILGAGTMIPWLIMLLVLTITLIVIPYAKISKYRKPSKPDPRFKNGDEVTLNGVNYEVAWIDTKHNYSLLHTENLTIIKIPVGQMDDNGILTKDFNKLKEKYGDDNE